MIESHRQIAAPCGLVVGAILGVAGTFASSASLRGLLWGIDGVALVVAGALLTIYHLGRKNNLVAVGFLVFVAGQTLVLSTAATPLDSAGPVFAAAVILPKDFEHPLLNDSKQLNEKQRYAAREIVVSHALSWAVAQVDPQEIDQINILNASFLAMHRALNQLPVRPESLLIDGNRF